MVKQVLSTKQKLRFSLTPRLLNQIKLLSASRASLNNEILEIINELEEKDKSKRFYRFKDEFLHDKYRSFFKNNQSIETVNLLEESETLRNKLTKQLEIAFLNDVEILIGEFLIDSIEDSGRLDPEINFTDLKLIVKEDFNLNIKNKSIEKVLKVIQNFEPVGCGYRSIEESIEVQIKNLEIDDRKKEEAWDIIQKIKHKKISKDSIPSEFKQIFKRINLDPGINLVSDENIYIQPDVKAFKHEDHWTVIRNDKFFSDSFKEAIKETLKETTITTRNNVQSFFKGYEKRQETLLRVSKYIVRKQHRYLDKKKDLIPLTNVEIARSLNLNPSTISRIIKSKYIQTPSQVFRLEKLCEKSVSSKLKGNEISPNNLISLISKVIKSENKSYPLTDNQIKDSLRLDFSINLARRTVSKYRELAELPPAYKRKDQKFL
tara:strand:- start:25571 stop:26869 length:1299 start_codon:yes stop_codon:yes gene_type:complete